MITLFIGYLLVAFFIFLEGRLRADSSARSLEQGEQDRRSTQAIGLGLFISVLSLIAALPLDLLNVAIIASPLAGWIGVVIAALGIGLRAWANRTLGRFYSRVLQIADQQVIVQSGPYRLLRHPGYLGSILLWVGSALASLNWIALGLAFVVMFSVYIYRIQVEEEMLLSTFGERYREYRAHTWRLIPFIF